MLSAIGCFFVQAEAGILDISVTGVQPCALPILPMILPKGLCIPVMCERFDPRDVFVSNTVDKIGRASCRERVYVWVVDGYLKEEECTSLEKVVADAARHFYKSQLEGCVKRIASQ